MRRGLAAEALGTGLLLYVIVGSGIAAQSLGTDGAAQLLAHALVVGIGLGVLILLFQSVSGSHFNPSVTLALWRSGTIGGGSASGYVVAQPGGEPRCCRRVGWPPSSLPPPRPASPTLP